MRRAGRDDPDRQLLASAANQLGARFVASEVEEILALARCHHGEARAALPREETRGARMILGWAAFDVALYRALLERGTAQEEARRIVADTNWEAYQRRTAPFERILRLFTRDPFRITVLYAKLTRRPLFKAPGWIMKDVPVEGGHGFDVQRCPLADYFRPLGLAKLCEEALCALDTRQAEARGVRLERRGTLVAGAERCDFRFSPGR